MADNRRWPRVRQRGIECSVEGCTGGCVGNDLCAKHNMAKHRLTAKGMAQVKEYNKRYKCPDVNKVCVHCKKGFVTARKSQELCNGCSPTAGAYIATKKYRAKFPEKTRIQDRTNKRINRDKTLERQPCEVCGEESAEAHHYDYIHPLNINWLCKKHHGEEHRRLKEVGNQLGKRRLNNEHFVLSP